MFSTRRSSRMSNGSNERMSNDQTESQLTDEKFSSRYVNGDAYLKKGPWTAAEDAALKEYVKKHGEGNWNAVKRHSALPRCGKSCRLRWTNHLKPNLRKGAFTQEEQQLIIELHSEMGNKWARMASHLPGRTDNEVKNFWNTRVKRHQRAGLPLYPPEFSLLACRNNQRGLNIAGTYFEPKGHHELLPNCYEIPDVTFDTSKASDEISNLVSEIPDISSRNGSFIPPTMHCQERLRQPTSPLSGYSGSGRNGFSLFGFQTGIHDKVSQSFGLSFPFDSDPNTNTNTKNQQSLGDNDQGGHSLSYGNISASKPTPCGAVKLELPSLQYTQIDSSSWRLSSPPLLDSIYSSIQRPPPGTADTNCPSLHNSGLLDALLYEANALSRAKSHSCKSSNSSTADIVDSSTLNACDSGWENYSDPLSPLGHTAATSYFSKCTPISGSGSSLDEPPTFTTSTGRGIKSEAVDYAFTPDTAYGLDITRPPVGLLASDWLEQGSAGKDQIFHD